jgi:hypothetical protein
MCRLHMGPNFLISRSKKYQATINNSSYIVSRLRVIIDRFGFGNGFIDYLQVVIADFHITNRSTLSLLSLLSLVVTW